TAATSSRSSRPRAVNSRIACGSVLMPTPSSRMVSDCSNNSQSMPRARNISAVVRPPMPPPTMIAFISSTPTLPSSSTSPRLRGEVGSPLAIRVRGYRTHRVHGSRREPLTPALSPQGRGEGGDGESLPFGLFGCKRLCRLGFQLGAGFRLTLNFEVLEILPVAHAVAENLFLAGQILRRTGDIGAVPGRRPHRKGWINQMRPAQRHQVGAAGGQNGVDLVGRGDVADAHGGYPGFVADLVG